jgi:hypothetical protein
MPTPDEQLRPAVIPVSANLYLDEGGLEMKDP